MVANGGFGKLIFLNVFLRICVTVETGLKESLWLGFRNVFFSPGRIS